MRTSFPPYEYRLPIHTSTSTYTIWNLSYLFHISLGSVWRVRVGLHMPHTSRRKTRWNTSYAHRRVIRWKTGTYSYFRILCDIIISCLRPDNISNRNMSSHSTEKKKRLIRYKYIFQVRLNGIILSRINHPLYLL